MTDIRYEKLMRHDAIKFGIGAIALLLLAICFSSCTHYLQADKNQSALLDKAYSDAMAIYNAKDYSYNDERYEVVADELQLVKSFDQSRTGGKELVQMDDILIKGFNARRTYHKSNIITDKKIWDEERRYMQAYFNPRIRAEQSINKSKK